MQGQPPLPSSQADLCILPAALWRPGPASTPGASATAAGPAPRLPTAGLQLTGFVRLHSAAGPGLAHVSIYRRLGAAAPELLATTTASGSFEAGCMGLPGATWVTVWAEAPGYTLEPQQYLWRHASGYEARRLPFVAQPAGKQLPGAQVGPAAPERAARDACNSR